VRQNQEPFDIEKELYAHWTELLNQMGIEFLIAGHKHKLHILQPGDAALATNPAFTTLIGSETPTAFTAAYYTIYPHSLMARFRRSDGEIRLQTELARTSR